MVVAVCVVLTVRKRYGASAGAGPFNRVWYMRAMMAFLWPFPSAMALPALALALWLGMIAPVLAQAEPPAETDTATDTAPPSPSVAVDIAGFTVVQAMAEDGTPLLDDAGNPVMIRIPLAESVITPGDDVVYVITLENQTPDPATTLQIGAQVAAEVLLDPYSVTSPEGLALDWADAESPDAFAPVFVMVEGAPVMQADLDTIRTLRLTLPELAAGAAQIIEYSVTLR